MKVVAHPDSYKARLWRQRLALAFALLVLLRVVAWDFHHVVEAHAADETCEVCLVFERAVDGIPSQCGKPTLAAVSDAPAIGHATLSIAGPRTSHLPRGPPLLRS